MSIPPKPRRTAPRDEDTSRRRQTMTRLMDAAERLIREKGFDATSVTEIAAAAGVVPSLINAYFLGKSGLLFAVTQRYNRNQLAATRAAAATPGSAADRIGAILLTWARLDLAEPRLYAAITGLSWTWPAETERQYREDLEPFWDIVMDVARDGIAAGEFRPLERAEVREIVFALHQWGMRPGIFLGESPETCAARVTRQVLTAFGAPPHGAG
ncbi:TetR/AcrR family transcriptional regulator [Neoroseomonas rubea]|uniref:TetR/AcrR family transcriptional regulator n=1 Tax=Neoroseomonas rubea TaxID=2748666 RepID=UPI0018DFABCB|nr:TetR/AcrR family transcriptional regulator [Roseomonas rubea]